jgi:hypothetical protein
MTWSIPTPEGRFLLPARSRLLTKDCLSPATICWFALADLAVLKGRREHHWKSTRATSQPNSWAVLAAVPSIEIGSEATGLILQQNTGKQAAIISQIADSRQVRHLCFV